MMKKQTKKTTVSTSILLLLLGLLGLSTPQLIGIRNVNATETNMIWGSKYDQTYEEITAATDVCSYIMNKFYTYMSYNWNLNAYGTSTTKANVDSCTSECNDDFDESVVFYTGHGWNESTVSGTYHYHVYSNDYNTYNNGIQDASIHSRTTEGTHYFAFIWACFQGNEVGYDHATGGVGMPHAWTQNDDLNLDGYTNDDETPHTFLGFKNTSPPLHYDAVPYSYEYGNFVKYVYYFLTYHHETIHDALDDAADWVFGSDAFDESELWTGFEWDNPSFEDPMIGNMVVYGNSWNELPY